MSFIGGTFETCAASHLQRLLNAEHRKPSACWQSGACDPQATSEIHQTNLGYERGRFRPNRVAFRQRGKHRERHHELNRSG
jgi:hypothetical protein